jgi:hypothetical protein
MFLAGRAENRPVKRRGIPHLAKNERDTPNFLYAALDKAACAPFYEERRINFAEPNELNRKSGMWGTRWSLVGKDPQTIPFHLPVGQQSYCDTLYSTAAIFLARFAPSAPSRFSHPSWLTLR